MMLTEPKVKTLTRKILEGKQMTPVELFEYDVNGYLYLENVLDPMYLGEINNRMDDIEQQIIEERGVVGLKENPFARFDDIVNIEPVFLPLVDHTCILPYLREMIDHPRLKSTWITYKWQGGGTGFHSNHTPTVTHNYYHYNGQIRHNLINVLYAFKDIEAEGGALQLIPGSHKANYVIPRGERMDHLKIKLPMKAGSALLFTHDLNHGSINSLREVRRTAIFTYCPGVIANSYGGDGLYDRLFEASPESSWRKYLLRRPNGFKEMYPQPELTLE